MLTRIVEVPFMLPAFAFVACFHGHPGRINIR
jgi:hypothetical protein